MHRAVGSIGHSKEYKVESSSSERRICWPEESDFTKIESMQKLKFAQITALFLFCLHLVSGLYEDQVGKFDW